jgi:uncharacterized metal-binding protein YceD (DUF177 family)
MLSLLDPRLYIAFAIACGVSYAAGRYQQYRADEKAHAADMALAAEKTRELERNAEKVNQRITDALSEANRRASANGRLAADRLRALSAARSEAAAACSRLDAPAAGTLPGVVRESLVNEAERADELARQLEALQSYVREVVKP